MHSVKLTSGRFKTCYQTSERTKSCICAIFTGNGGNNPPQPATVQEERKALNLMNLLCTHTGVCVRSLVLQCLAEHLFLCPSTEGCGL